MNNNRPLHAKDLMLGDWVKWGYTTAFGVKVGGYKMQVAAIYQDDSVDLVDSDSYYEHVPMDEVEAIPLTEGMLKKNADVIEAWQDADVSWVRRHYVHELQHALRLAGIGKEIAL
jgi:protein associated with RNAse G/E